MKPIAADAPFQTVVIDIVGPLPTTVRGNKWILVMMDRFSKWPECVALRNVTAATVAKAFLATVVTRHGVPLYCQSDRGAQFTSNMFAELSKMLGMKQKLSCSYRPQTHGLVERWNKTMAQMLRQFTATNQKDWCLYLDLVAWAYRTSKHSSTRLTPFQVLHGREARLPTHLLSPVEEELYSSDVEYVDQLQQKLKDIFDLVRENNSKASAQQKKYHDRRVNPSNLQPGDTVFLMRPHPKVGISPKLQPRFQGPYALLLILGHNGLVSARGKSFWVHLNHLKLVHVRRREPFDYEGAVEEEAGRESTEQEDLDMTDSEEMTRDLVPGEEATTGHDADLRGDQEAEDSSEEESQLEGGRSRYNLRSRRK